MTSIGLSILFICAITWYMSMCWLGFSLLFEGPDTRFSGSFLLLMMAAIGGVALWMAGI